MLSDIPGNASSEALFSIYDTPSRRPYQAYCVTEASSRPPSPDPLIAEPVRASVPPFWQAVSKAEIADTERFEQNNSCIQAAASSPEQYVGSVTLCKVGQDNKRQTSPSNGKFSRECTRSGKHSNHITRAVSPRGSHSLASSEVIAYDRPPSHTRLRQLEFSTRTDIRSVSSNPMGHGSLMVPYQRPLPPLPLEADLLGPELNQENDTWSKGAYADAYEKSRAQDPLAFTKLNSSNTETLPRWKSAEYLIPHQPLPDPPVLGLWSRGTVLDKRVTPLGSIGHLYNATVCESSRSLWKRDVSSDCTQNFPIVELHVPCGHWEDTDDDMRVINETQDEYASLRYQFGQLPSRESALPPLISQQRDSCPEPVHLPVSSAPSFHTSSDIQNGPRPPPWGSYEDLEIQRRQRGGARERANVHLTRLTVNSTSTYQKSISSDSVGKSPSREVEQYREQILGVYPDMKFSRDDGLGDPRWCCCVMM